MTMERYYEREWRIEEIEKRGGTFVLKNVLEKGIFGNIVDGTLHLGNGESADVMARRYPAGGMKIIGPAKRTVEGVKGYQRIITAFNELEEDTEYAKTATRRQIIAALFNLLLVVMIIGISVDIIFMDLTAFGLSLLGMKVAVFLLTAYAAVVSRRF